MINFFKEVEAELKKVTFSSKNEVARLTAIVIGISVIVGLFIGAGDFVFTKILEIVIK